MNQESWHAVTPQFNEYDVQFGQYATTTKLSLLEVQPRLRSAFTRFFQFNGVCKVLMLKAPDNTFYRETLKRELSIHYPSNPVHHVESLDFDVLFGSYSTTNDGQLNVEKQGLLSLLQGGVLIVSANLILANPVCWFSLKSALFGGKVSPVNTDTKKPLSANAEYDIDIKIIVTGDREQLADIDYLDADMHSGLSIFSELELELALNIESIDTYLGYLKWLCEQYQFPTLTTCALKRLMVAGSRETEDQDYMPLDILWYRALIEESLIVADDKTRITGDNIDTALEEKYFRESYLPERALSDILDGQVIIETDGEQVGQVNGLTVIDIPGHPISYGEPARISCVIHFGDGDISDVERKAELGGNLHAKGMMIMQAFVSSALNLDESLPYSASVVFEQSYCEVDGDSASLAELCSFVSALSEYPIDQQIAVTGAVDQFGRVQAVGGLNEKIEGFYHVCKHQGFTGKQGVILPKSNLKHLALHKDVLNSIRNDEFHIWSVNTVDEAIPILMNHPFRGDDSSVIEKIAERIENYERHEHPPGFVERIKHWFV